MTRPLNLYDGLEALYYLDSEHFDAGANEMSDRSGYGRHAEASGGPTVGVDGPDGFEATSFDGSDDELNINGPALTGDFTVATLVQYGDGIRRIHTALSTSELITLNPRRGDELRFEHFDSNGDFREIERSGATTGEYYLQLGMYDAAQTKVTNRVVGLGSDSHTNGFRDQPEIAALGYEPRQNKAYYDANIVFSGFWGRLLSEAEIQYLDALTAPRRAQL